MKKLIVVFLSLISITFLSSCQAKTNNTVERLPLSEAEQKIAELTSDIVEKFILDKDRVYDINIYLYKDNQIENNGGVLGIDTKGKDETVLISGRKDGEIGFAWNISCSGSIAKSPAIEINDDKAFMMVYGIGQEKFEMAEDKEYVLIFVAYKEGNQMRNSIADVFYTWDTIDDKAEALAEFSYAYIVTVKYSDLPEYKDVSN